MQVDNGYFNVLGMKVKDKVTNFVGVADSLNFDLYGCVQVSVRPVVDEKNEFKDPKWFDFHRLEITSKAPVLELPNFAMNKAQRDASGPAEKSVPSRG